MSAPVNITGTVNPTPYYTGGTGTIGWSTTMADNSRLAFDLITPMGTHDHLAVTPGTMSFTGPGVNIDLTGGGTAVPGDYILVAGVSGTEPSAYTVTLPALWTAAAPRFVGSNLMINITSTGASGYAT